MSIKQKLSQKTLQKLSPQRIQLMKLIQMPVLDLERKVEQEIAENPALTDTDEESANEEQTEDATEQDFDHSQEEDSQEEKEQEEEKQVEEYLENQDDYEEVPRERSLEREERPRQIVDDVHTTLYDFLMEQLHTVVLEKEHWFELAEYLIGSLDRRGYLVRPLGDISDDLAFSHDLMVSASELEEVLKVIQGFDPPGVACIDLQECLILQLERIPGFQQENRYRLAMDILKKSFDSFTKNKMQLLAEKHRVDHVMVQEAVAIIKGLNPKPGIGYGGARTTTVIPDFSISIRDEKIHLEINGRNAPRLFISRSYINMLSRYEEGSSKHQSQKQAAQFIREKIDAARNFIDSIYQREHTLFRVVSTIIDFQYEYFLTGDRSLIKPMVLRDVAQKIDMDISTISRVASKKYASTPYGIVSLKDLFSEGVNTESGADISSIKVKELIKDFIKKEQKDMPLSDEKISKMLGNQGVVTARRTVAKYREQLKIPVARLRKEV